MNIYFVFFLCKSSLNKKLNKFCIREGLKKNLNTGWIYPSGLASWGQQGVKIQPKKIDLKKKYKDDKNGLIHPEN